MDLEKRGKCLIELDLATLKAFKTRKIPEANSRKKPKPSKEESRREREMEDGGSH